MREMMGSSGFKSGVMHVLFSIGQGVP
jgi:hypothetical protein